MELISLISVEQFARQQHRNNSDFSELWDWLDAVKDPEIPAVSIWDLGILQDVKKEGEKITVVITPTYSGCPAMDLIREDIETLLQRKGIKNCSVDIRLSPAWTTGWITKQGREQLYGFGIAPPSTSDSAGQESRPSSSICCPNCHSDNTRVISEFGSTACKALLQCNDCHEPFDYFKNI